MPLVNADRLTLSLLPPVDAHNMLKPWAAQLRDHDKRWQHLSQDGVQLFMGLAMDQGMPFAFETVFSYLQEQPDGSIASKIEVIRTLQAKGYYVILFFVGLAGVELSILRVSTRKNAGGHDVPVEKLRERFPRTQRAISMASEVADLTIMLDNSRSLKDAFSLVRAQRKKRVLYDCRTATGRRDRDLVSIASQWLVNVAPMKIR
jgi:predicted ABC-type ATPase